MHRLPLALLLFALAIPAQAQRLAVAADTLYTMAGPPIVNGVVLMRDGKIERVGAGLAIPEGVRTLRASVVTPGLVDVRGTVGLSGLLNQPQDQDQIDEGGPIQPSLRALDAYNARDELVPYLLGFGVTTVHTGHTYGAIAAGQTVVVKTAYDTVDEALVDSTTMLAMSIGPSVTRRFSSPGSRSRVIADLRKALYKAKAASSKADSSGTVDLDQQAWAQVLSGDMPALVTAHRANDILTLLRVAREFPTMNLILDGGAESYLVLDELRDAGISVVLHPTMIRMGGETQNASFTTAATLHEAGIPFAIQSGYEAYVPKTRVVLFEAAAAAAHGLPREAALASVTLEAATILGLADRVGSIETGKDADLALFDGDPLETTSHVCAVIVDGRVASEECQ
ncbi:MAG: amidohydrolase family protein [Rubricoccaceae bacterium]